MARREEILFRALELINDRGYVNIGVREIARALEISPGNLTYHFSKKDEILVALLEQYRDANSGIYEDYFAQDSSLENFLKLMKRIFESQFQYRGVFVGNQYLQDQIIVGQQFNYDKVYKKRVDGYIDIFEKLDQAGHINVTDADISFLVSHMTLFGRFWIFEATIFNKSPEKEPTIKHYLSLLAKVMSLFASEKGLKSIDRFMKEI